MKRETGEAEVATVHVDLKSELALTAAAVATVAEMLIGLLHTRIIPSATGS